jgi:hypothetical protein
MRDLIRRILKEHVNKETITLEEINLPDGFLDILIIEGKATTPIPSGLEKELMSYISKKYNWPPSVNNKWCSDIKEKENKDDKTIIKSCNKVFEFELSNHWLRRLFRKNEPEYKKNGRFEGKSIENPNKTEGIDIFFNSKDKINDFIDNSGGWQPMTEKFILLTNKSNMYQVIISLRKEKKSNYLAKFITQIKGEKFFDTPELKKSIRL